MIDYKVNEKAQLFVKLNDYTNVEKILYLFDKLILYGMSTIQLCYRTISDNIIEKVNYLARNTGGNIIFSIYASDIIYLDRIDKEIKCITIIKGCGENIASCFFKSKFNAIKLYVNSVNDCNNELKLLELYNNIDCIILSKNYKLTSFDLSLYNDIDEIYSIIKRGLGKETFLDIGLFKKNFLLNHPCNIYLCNGSSCHTGKNKFVRRLFISEEGNVLPESFNFGLRFSYGNINTSDINEIIAKVELQNDALIKLSKYMYNNILLHTQYEYIPINLLLETLSKDDKILCSL